MIRKYHVHESFKIFLEDAFYCTRLSLPLMNTLVAFLLKMLTYPHIITILFISAKSNSSLNCEFK